MAKACINPTNKRDLKNISGLTGLDTNIYEKLAKIIPITD
jgi:hypothetical protein